MAMVAVLHPTDFPEMNGPAAPNLKASRGSSVRASSRSQSRRPQRPSRQVAPVGWTMCECEADKEWVLCDRAEAMAAELAEKFKQLNQDADEVSKASVGETEDSHAASNESKEDTMRRVQQQLVEEEEEIMRAREEMMKAKEEMVRAKEEMKRVEEEMKRKQENAAPVKEDTESKEEDQELSVKVCSRKQLSKAERKAAWKASQELGQMSCSLVEMHQVLERQRAGLQQDEAMQLQSLNSKESDGSTACAKPQRAKSRSRQPESAEAATKLEISHSKERTGSPARAKSQRAKSRRRRAVQDDDC